MTGQLRASRDRHSGRRPGWTVSLVAGLVMMALMYLPLDIPLDVLGPVLLIVATAVQFWAGAPIYRAAWAVERSCEVRREGEGRSIRGNPQRLGLLLEFHVWGRLIACH